MKFEGTQPKVEDSKEAAPSEDVIVDSAKRAEFEETFANLEAAFMAYKEIAEQEAKQDPLTGVYNRRGLQEQWKKVSANLKHKDKQPREGDYEHCAILLVDIDHFKKINDTYGHPIGDAVLRGLAGSLSAGMRANDILARFGGEEFAVVFPGSTAESVLKKFGYDPEKNTPAHFTFTLTGSEEEIPVTMSGGVVDYRIDDPDETLETAIARADGGLYKAKQNGRNKIIGEEVLSK